MSHRELPIENIPQSLRELPQWFCWRFVPKPTGKPDKLPVDIHDRPASTADPRTWSSFDEAVAAFQRNKRLDGIAFVFTEADPFAGVDLDDCLDEDGGFLWGEDIVGRLPTYCETSVSGRGLHLILQGKKPVGAKCRATGFGPDGKGKVEVYDQGRCFIFTGRRLEGSPEEPVVLQAELTGLCEELWPAKIAAVTPPAVTSTIGSNLPLNADGGRISDCYRAMLGMGLIDHGDGSFRLFSACCRCVEYDLSDSEAIATIRRYATAKPFPKHWSDAEILKRLQSAEDKCVRGVALDQKHLPRFKDANQMLADHQELRTPVIHGLLRIGETMNVIASPKVGKSWLVTDLAMSVASGRRWLEWFDVEQGRVLILDNELHPETSSHRLAKVAEARGISMSEIGNQLYVDNLRGRLADIHSLQPYFAALPVGFFKVVVLDAFYRFMPKDADENSNGNVTDAYNKLDSYAAMLGCSFVLIHHSSKGNQSGKSVTDVGAGAGSQSRASDTHLVLRQHEEQDCVVVDAAVRSWHPLPSRCIRWSFPVWGLDDTLDPAFLKPERPRRPTKPKADKANDEPEWTPERFVETFVGADLSSITTIHAAAKRGGVSLRLSKDLLKLAEDAGLVHRWLFGGNRPVKFSTQPQPELVDQSD